MWNYSGIILPAQKLANTSPPKKYAKTSTDSRANSVIYPDTLYLQSKNTFSSIFFKIMDNSKRYAKKIQSPPVLMNTSVGVISAHGHSFDEDAF
jgi:hypothetical protein